ncbi:MAG: ribosome biogenesis factor YjgA [Betaproteobacteria bacterium]
MRRSDETPRRPGQEVVPRAGADPSGDADSAHSVLSKTRRKQAMLALQELGVRLTELGPARLSELALPERLADAITSARSLSGHEARRRQMQYVGRLMRDIDPAPIEAALARWAQAPNAEKARLADVERWRDRLLDEPAALDALCAAQPTADRAALQELVARVGAERSRGSPPHAFRELFRALNALLAAPHR